jgi:uncharacterized protein (TIGR02271 family)
MMNNASSVQPGWTVYDQNGDKVGDVADVGPGYLLIQKGLIFTKDIYVPMNQVRNLDEDRQLVYIDVASGDVDSMGWDQPPAATSAEGMTGGTSSWDTTTGGSATSGSTAASGSAATDAERLRLHEETLQAQTRRAQAGEVEVGKRVVEDRQEFDVPVTHEEVEIRRVPASGSTGVGGDAFTSDGDTIRVPVSAETVEVTKQPRVVEEIEISKRQVTESQRVGDTVRREEADIRPQGDVTMTEQGSTAGELVGSGADRTSRASLEDAESLGDQTVTDGDQPADTRW